MTTVDLQLAYCFQYIFSYYSLTLLGCGMSEDNCNEYEETTTFTYNDYLHLRMKDDEAVLISSACVWPQVPRSTMRQDYEYPRC